MKKTINAAIGGRNFILDEDAYRALEEYLNDFRSGMDASKDAVMTAEVMEELEMRIADLLIEKLNGREVIDVAIVRSVTDQLGTPNWKTNGNTNYSSDMENNQNGQERPVRRFYRDLDDKMLGGVCSGLGYFFNIDVVLVRILFVIALFLGSAGFWIYIIFWLIAPAARTASARCEMRGLPATAENIRRFSGKNQYER